MTNTPTFSVVKMVDSETQKSVLISFEESLLDPESLDAVFSTDLLTYDNDVDNLVHFETFYYDEDAEIVDALLSKIQTVLENFKVKFCDADLRLAKYLLTLSSLSASYKQ